MNKLLYSCCVIFLTFVSCKEEKLLPQDPLEYFSNRFIPLTAKVIDINDPTLSGASRRLINDSILVMDDSRSDTIVILVNLRTKRVVRKIIGRGRGPGEALALNFCYHPCKDTLWVNDILTRTVYRVDVAKAIGNPNYQIEKLTVIQDHTPFVLLYTGENFLGAISEVDGRFGLYDRNGNFLKTFLKYPKPERYKTYPERVFATGFQGPYTICSERRKIAFSTIASGNIHIFNYSKDSIELAVDLIFFDPEMVRGQWDCQLLGNRAKMGFTDIDSNRDGIYVLYSGKYMRDYRYTGGESECNYLLIFDWDGKPVKGYFLDKALISMSINREGDKIYGITYDPEATIVQYDLK